jgi:hypothetical protein
MPDMHLNRSSGERRLKNDMDTMKIPKFDNETDEANWAYEHREELAEAFIGQYRQQDGNRGSRRETVLGKAHQTTDLVIAPEELNGRTLVSVLREKLQSK